MLRLAVVRRDYVHVAGAVQAGLERGHPGRGQGGLDAGHVTPRRTRAAAGTDSSSHASGAGGSGRRGAGGPPRDAGASTAPASNAAAKASS